MKASSLQGIVRQPIGGLKPNSSSARLSKSWNEGWLKYDIGTTNLFLCISPTYIATCPFGTSGWFLQWRDLPLIMCLTLWIMDGKRMPMLIWFWAWKEWFEILFFFFFGGESCESLVEWEGCFESVFIGVFLGVDCHTFPVEKQLGACSADAADLLFWVL